MHLKRKLPPGRRHYLLASVLVFSISLICLAFSMRHSDGYDVSRREVLLRRIGHEILLRSGDSTSRVLPVKKLAENEYQISFERPFSFQPDSLVHTTKRLLSKDGLASDYVVSVLNCGDSGVVYGYAISGDTKDDIIACLGRRQPKACYLINIQFRPGANNTAMIGFGLGGLAIAAVVGLTFSKRAKPQEALLKNAPTLPEDQPALTSNPSANRFTLGTLSFDAESRKLVMDDKTIDLTKTETRVLRIFALSPNEVIERSRLQKEIWEDDGVIVGRSLDMFISKLRKKLEGDPTVKITVIRGKGYKLEIGA